jgi:4-diphosphocytidyl-2-C-methyl-D-erythritol kinase
MIRPPRLLAAAKINLFLKIAGRRPDGRHDLSSLVCFADYGDYLECEPAEQDQLELSGPLAGALKEAGGAGLIRAALQALRQAGCAIPPLAVRLEKNLPTGGGLGGGSADAAALLRFLPGFFDQPVAPDQLAGLAAGLGADVPACLAGGWLHMTGSGVQIRQLAQPQRLPFVVLANAGISVPTGPVFAAWPPCNRVTGRFYYSWAMIWPNLPASCIPLSLSFWGFWRKAGGKPGVIFWARR